MMNKNITRFTFRIPQELLKKLKKEAYRRGRSVNSFILELIEDWSEQKSA